jgi:hypothetical protein
MSPSSGELRAGVARCLINPPPRSYLIGYAARLLGSRGVHDDLTATALVLADGRTALAIAALDRLCLHEDVVERIRAGVAERTDVPAENVLLACSHTHAGPIAWAGEGSGRRRRRLIDQLVEKVVGVVAEARRELTPVELHFGVGRSEIAVNRRERGEDGRIVIGVNPDGPVDRSVGALQLRDEKGAVWATVVNLACHPATLSPRNRLVSADWPGVMRREIEAATGRPCLFLQGATADLNPDRGSGSDEFAAVDRLGRAAASAVLARCEEGLEPIAGVPLAAAREEIPLPIRPRRSADGNGTEHYSVTAARQLGVPRWVIGPLLRYAYPWRPRLRAGPEGRPEMPMELQVLRLGDLVVVALAAEPFCEIGSAIKEQSPAPLTLFAGYSNGCIGYLTTAAAQDEGGYEAEEAPLAYRISGTFDPVCETLAVGRAVDLIARTLQQGRPAAADFHR